MFGSIAVMMADMIFKAKARQEWLDNLPKEEADKIRAEDARNEVHRRALEIAEAGRPRNFWGK